MSFLEEIQLEHNPLADSKVFAALFRDVQNVDFLQSQLLARNADFEYAFIDASTIFSRQQLLSAVFRALVDLQASQLSTPNVHSEVVLSLSPSNNISESYRRWGLTPGKTKDVLVVKIVPAPRETTKEDVWAHLTEHVKGTPVDVSDEEIAKSTDWQKVKKYYKLNGVPALDRIKDEAAKIQEMKRLAVMDMALRGL